MSPNIHHQQAVFIPAMYMMMFIHYSLTRGCTHSPNPGVIVYLSNSLTCHPQVVC